MFGFFKKKNQQQTPDASKIVPRIKHENFLTAIRNACDGRQIKSESMPVTEPLVADLIITYAFDLPGMFKMLSVGDLEALGMSINDVRSVAIRNLQPQIAGFTIEGKPPLLVPITGNNLEACLLLLDDVWDSFAGTLPAELVVGVPTRNDILVTSSQSVPGLKEIRNIIVEKRKQETTHGLTEHLLVRRNNKWEKFKS